MQESNKKKNPLIVPRKSKPEIVEAWALADLKDHPKQHDYFTEPTPEEVAKLAANLERNTQTDAVEITPRGVIISGHKRVLAARLLGWETIRVLVRYDLAGDEVAIEHRLIEANEDRRHLSTFERAWLQYRMWKLSSKENTRKARGEINDELAKTLGKTVRQVSRYIRLFDGPQELQDAVQDGRLLVSHAFDVLKLSEEQAEPILEELRRDEADMAEVRAMVKQAVAGNRISKVNKPEVMLSNFLKAGEDLAKHKNALKSLMTDKQRKSIARLRQLLDMVEGQSPAA